MRTVRCSPRPRERLSLLFCFCETLAIFTKKIMKKTDPIRVPDSGPKTGAVFRPLIVIIIDWRIEVPILGPESGPQNGPAFGYQGCKKMQPWVPRNGYHRSRKWTLRGRGSVSHSAPCTHRLGPLVRLQSCHCLAPPILNNMCTAGPVLHKILRLQPAHSFRRGCRLQRCSTIKSLLQAP